MVNIDWKLLLIGGFLVLFFLRECSHNSELNKKDSDFTSMQDFHKRRDSINLAKINSHAQDSVKMTQTIVEYENLSKELKEELKGYKDGSSLTETVISSVANDIIIEIHDTFYVDSVKLRSLGCECADSLLKEFRKKKVFYNFRDEWLNIVGHHTYNKVSFDTISFRNEFDVIIGSKREKWYKRRNQVVELKSYSPYTEVVYVNNVVTKDSKTKYQRIFKSKPAYFFYGILGGFVLNNNLK